MDLATNRNLREQSAKCIIRGTVKVRWRIRLIAQLRLPAAAYHRPSLLFLCYVAPDNVDPQRSQAAAVFDPSLEDNRRVSPAIERIHPGIRCSPRPGSSPRSIQQYLVFCPLQACPTPTAVWALVVQAEGSFIVHHDAAGQSAQCTSETTAKEQEAKYSDEHYPSQS